MYAVFETGGKQYQATPGELLNVEKIDAEIGDRVVFENVLLVKEDGKKAQIGQPLVDKATIEAEVIDQGKHKKIRIYTFKRRKGYDKQNGHRQKYTCLKVLKIAGGN